MFKNLSTQVIFEKNVGHVSYHSEKVTGHDIFNLFLTL